MENTVQPQMQNVNQVPQVLPPPPKSSPVLILLIILVIIAFGAIGFLFWQNQQLEKQLRNHTSAQSVNPEAIQTTVIPTRIDQHEDWLVYTDVKNGYQLSYPPTWKRVYSSPQSTEFTIESSKNELIHATPFNNEDSKYKNTDTSHVFVLNNKSVLLTYVACDGEGCGVGTQDLTTFSQILSTFKFTAQSQTDTSNWKTYTGDGYTINYPLDIKGCDKNTVYPNKISASKVAIFPGEPCGENLWIEAIQSNSDLISFIQTDLQQKLPKTMNGDKVTCNISQLKCTESVNLPDMNPGQMIYNLESFKLGGKSGYAVKISDQTTVGYQKGIEDVYVADGNGFIIHINTSDLSQKTHTLVTSTLSTFKFSER
jgi:hypothetical protein